MNVLSTVSSYFYTLPTTFLSKRQKSWRLVLHVVFHTTNLLRIVAVIIVNYDFSTRRHQQAIMY